MTREKQTERVAQQVSMSGLFPECHVNIGRKVVTWCMYMEIAIFANYYSRTLNIVNSSLGLPQGSFGQTACILPHLPCHRPSIQCAFEERKGS